MVLDFLGHRKDLGLYVFLNDTSDVWRMEMKWGEGSTTYNLLGGMILIILTA